MCVCVCVCVCGCVWLCMGGMGEAVCCGWGRKVEEEEERWGRGWFEHFELSITHFF